MTRKEALLRTIDAIERGYLTLPNTNSEDDMCEIVNALKLCLDELPFAKWSKRAIFDACDQFVAEHDRPLTVSDFSKYGLPPHTVIKHHFNMTAAEFRDTYYPRTAIENSRHRGYDKEKLLAQFAGEFVRIDATGRADYDRRRNKLFPVTATVMRLCGVQTWQELLTTAGVTPSQRNLYGRNHDTGRRKHNRKYTVKIESALFSENTSNE